MRIIIALTLILLISCLEEEANTNSVFIEIENKDSIDKYIFLDSWLTILNDRTYENNDFLFSSNILLNKIAILEKESHFAFNNSLITENDVKGALGNQKIRLALLKPKERVFIEYKSKLLPKKDEMLSKEIKYQVIYFKKQILDSLDNYTIFKSDTITIENIDEYVYTTRIDTKPLKLEEVKLIYKMDRDVIEDKSKR